MHEHSISASTHTYTQPELPPCCGTGCAVCVLDMVEDYAPPSVQTQPLSAVCCNTGCVVCVNDYPELKSAGCADAAAIELIEAMEAAERSLQS